MQWSGPLSVVMGLILGISITFEISRIFRRNQYDPSSFDDASMEGKTASTGQHKQRLIEEKMRLMQRLQEINAELETSETVAGTLSRYRMINSSSNSRNSFEQFSSMPSAKISERKVIDQSSTVPVNSRAGTTLASSLTLATCPYNFKVYVYDLPPDLGAVRFGDEARKNYSVHICHKCILEQFSLEYIIMDFFTQFCGRTENPEVADFFYLPLVRDAEFRVAQMRGTRNRAPSLAEEALIDALSLKMDKWKQIFEITDKYWMRRKGADHILVMPAPVTNLRHEASRRGFFHYMIHLHTPIFLCLEYSVGFVREYPTCSTKKNIVVPYPTTDPELYNGKLFSVDISRSYLLYYAGGMHGDCIEVRRGMKFLVANSTRLPGVVPPIRSNQAEREHGFLAATFCPIPVGDSPSSKRMYDVLNFGCIPVVLSDDLVWAFTQQSGGPLNYSTFAIHIPQSVLHFTAQRSLRQYFTRRSAMGTLPTGRLIYDLLEASVNNGGDYMNGRYVNPIVQILKAVTKEEIKILQAGVRKVAPLFQYYSMDRNMHQIPTAIHTMPTGSAMKMITDRLNQQKLYGIDNLRDACEKERLRPNHVYEHRSTCDASKEESLLPRHRRRLTYRRHSMKT